MRDSNGRNHKPAGTPGAGQFESEGDDTDLDMDTVPDIPYLPPEPELEPRHDWKDRLSTLAITTGVAADCMGVMFGIVKFGTILSGWIATLPHPGLIVGGLAAVLIPAALALDPRMHK